MHQNLDTTNSAAIIVERRANSISGDLAGDSFSLKCRLKNGSLCLGGNYRESDSGIIVKIIPSVTHSPLPQHGLKSHGQALDAKELTSLLPGSLVRRRSTSFEAIGKKAVTHPSSDRPLGIE
jgi:hypothetical protein